MRQAYTCLALLAIVAAGTPALVHADASTSPGKESVHVSSTAGSLPGFQTTAILTTLVSGTLKMGKPHRVLAVEGVLNSIGAGENAYIEPVVNGVFFEPHDSLDNGASSASVNCPVGATIGCSASGSWWLDLDTAEAAHPGTFIGKPLIVELKGFTSLYNGIAGPLVSTMSARLEKK